MDNSNSAPLIIIDDDPTGPQSVTEAAVALEINREAIAGAARQTSKALYILTNSRALQFSEALSITREGAEAARSELPNCRFVLRGDSTLRGHVFEKYLGLRDVLYGSFGGATKPVLLLVPSLPDAGRITVDGVQVICEDRTGDLTPLDQTEYARDPQFAYRSANLLEWAEERSRGYFAKERGELVPLARLRSYVSLIL